MAETQIEWTDATWNPVAGCSIVTAGCTHCYAMEMAKRLEAMGVQKYAGLTRKTGRRTVWNGVVREDRQALTIPHRWRKPRKIFVNSMSDLFHDRVTDEFILDVWQVMRETPRHNYQILTKRPERMAELVSDRIGEVLAPAAFVVHAALLEERQLHFHQTGGARVATLHSLLHPCLR